MQFNVWDFPEQMQIRFNDSFTSKLKGITKEITVHQKATKRHKAFIFKRHVRLISHRGHGCLGTKLFANLFMYSIL